MALGNVWIRGRWFAAWLPLAAAGCSSAVQEQVDVAAAAVHILATDQLAEPQVRATRVFQPTFEFSHQGRGPAGDLAFGFFVHVTSSDAQALQARLRSQDGGKPRPLQRIAPPANPRTLQADDATWQLDDAVQATLSAGTGVFWIAGPTAPPPGTTRLAIALPATTLAPVATLELFTHTAADGAVLAGDRLELARAFFYVAFIGDSVVWGNGLRTADKFSTQVADHIERRLGRKVISQKYAVSGATIRTSRGSGACPLSCAGEVPKVAPSIMRQAELIQRPDLMDLIVLDGCANDIGLSTILSAEIDPAEIEMLSRQACGGYMTDLLMQVRYLAPQARVVVTGYPLVISEDSDVSDLEEWLMALDVSILPVEDFEAFVDKLMINSAVFLESSRTELQSAVAAVNGAADPPVVIFADPGYANPNAAFAPQAWLWGLTTRTEVTRSFDLNLDLRLLPEDPLLDERISACGQPGVLPSWITCLYNSVGHPNPAGARSYATAIARALETMQILPAAE